MELDQLIKKIDRMVNFDGSITNSVHYKAYCKLAASLCFDHNLREDGIYYLSEAHGVALREKCYRRYVFNKTMEQFEKNTSSAGLDFKYTSFQSHFANKRYEGLLDRLKELPKEWTVVQITLPFETKERWNLRPPNLSVDIKGFYIVKYYCGDDREPNHVYLSTQNDTSAGVETILGLLQQTVLDKSCHPSTDKRPKSVREKRLKNCEILKRLVQKEIIADWLREWCFLLLGKLCNSELESKINNVIGKVLESSEVNVPDYNKNLIYQLANGCAHLEENAIANIVASIIEDNSLQTHLTTRILEIRNDNCTLISVKRYPVILIVDEKLECVPWEVLPLLRKHPVCRMNSIHFVHALYKAHEKSIVSGNKVVTGTNAGYYIVNPDLSLQNTEERIKQFLHKRFDQWSGVIGLTPTKEKFCAALTDYNLFLYCGHGSGAQYMSVSCLYDKTVKALPLLFGCSSVEYKDFGGRVPFLCHADSLIVAASPCVLGMLWSVTSKDADNMALALLNHWLPGKPITLEGVEQPCNSDFQEPELLRALKIARDVAVLYMNSCALVVYGIPVIVER